MSLPPRRFQTEEQQREARRQYNREYRLQNLEKERERSRRYHATHREQERLKGREYEANHREERRMKHLKYNQEHRDEIIRKKRELYGRFGPETLTEEDKVSSSELTSENDWIKQEMSKELHNAPFEDYVQFCQTNDMTKMENIKKAYLLAKHSIAASNTQRGFQFERVFQTLMLNKFEDTQFKVYRQVPYGNDYNLRNGRRIDFVITEENISKEKLDLSKAVVVSCKTGFGTRWREDQDIYDKCKTYIMISLAKSIPQESLQDNVFFCVPDKDIDDHIINMDYFTDFIIQKLTDHI